MSIIKFPLRDFDNPEEVLEDIVAQKITRADKIDSLKSSNENEKQSENKAEKAQTTTPPVQKLESFSPEKIAELKREQFELGVAEGKQAAAREYEQQILVNNQIIKEITAAIGNASLEKSKCFSDFDNLIENIFAQIIERLSVIDAENLGKKLASLIKKISNEVDSSIKLSINMGKEFYAVNLQMVESIIKEIRSEDTISIQCLPELGDKECVVEWEDGSASLNTESIFAQLKELLHDQGKEK